MGASKYLRAAAVIALILLIEYAIELAGAINAYSRPSPQEVAYALNTTISTVIEKENTTKIVSSAAGNLTAAAINATRSAASAVVNATLGKPVNSSKVANAFTGASQSTQQFMAAAAIYLYAPLQIFINNAPPCIFASVPVEGWAAIGYILYQTGYLVGSAMAAAGVPPSTAALVLASPVTMVELLAYAVSTYASTLMLKPLIDVARRKRGKASIADLRPWAAALAAALAILLAASLIEYAALP